MISNTDKHHAVTKEHEINLIDYWRVIAKRKKSILLTVLVVSIVAIIYSLLIPNTYKANAVIVSVSERRGGGLSSLASQFGGIASLAGIDVSSGGGGGGAKIMALLKSRTLTENVIKHMNLMPILFEKQWDLKKGAWKNSDKENQPNMERAVSLMRSSMSFSQDKKMHTIGIAGVFRDPKLAADVVNGYVNELQNFINASSLTSSKRNRIFIESQLEMNKKGLLLAGKAINAFYEAKGVSTVDANIDVDVDIRPELDQIVQEIPGRNSFNEDQSSVLLNLMVRKDEVEQKIADAKMVKNVPQQVYLTYLMMRREILAKVNALLTTQYEMAKIKEAKDDLSFEVIDVAVVPILKYKPKRAQICIMFFIVSLFMAVMIAFAREYLQKMKALHG